jgi:hypothetical protein
MKKPPMSTRAWLALQRAASGDTVRSREALQKKHTKSIPYFGSSYVGVDDEAYCAEIHSMRANLDELTPEEVLDRMMRFSWEEKCSTLRAYLGRVPGCGPKSVKEILAWAESFAGLTHECVCRECGKKMSMKKSAAMIARGKVRAWADVLTRAKRVDALAARVGDPLERRLRKLLHVLRDLSKEMHGHADDDALDELQARDETRLDTRGGLS